MSVPDRQYLQWMSWTLWRIAQMLSEGDFYYRIAKVCCSLAAFVIVTCYALLGNRQIDIFMHFAVTLAMCALSIWEHSTDLIALPQFQCHKYYKQNVVALCDQGDKHKTGEQNDLKVNTHLINWILTHFAVDWERRSTGWCRNARNRNVKSSARADTDLMRSVFELLMNRWSDDRWWAVVGNAEEVMSYFCLIGCFGLSLWKLIG